MNSKKIGVKGRFRTELIEGDGSVTFDSGEQDNLIVDGALNFDRFPYYPFLCLGAGVVTAPSVTDTALGNQIASAIINLQPSIYSSNTRSYTGWNENNGRTSKAWSSADFNGFADNTEITELGLRGGSSNGQLITRSLIKDSNGNPTTITVGSGQTLRITYYVYYFYPDVLASGITSTPHGNLEWELRLVNKNHYHDKMAGLWDIFKYNAGSLAFFMPALAISDSAYDLANHTVTRTITAQASPSDATVLAGDEIAKTGGDYPSAKRFQSPAYDLIALSDYTVPANHDFKMTVQLNWGRMP